MFQIRWIICVIFIFYLTAIHLLLRAFHVARHVLGFITWRYHIKDDGGVRYEPSIRRGGGRSGWLYRCGVRRRRISVQRNYREFSCRKGSQDFYLVKFQLTKKTPKNWESVTQRPRCLIGAKHRETMKYLRGSLILGMLTVSELLRSPPVELLLLDYNDNSTISVTPHHQFTSLQNVIWLLFERHPHF